MYQLKVVGQRPLELLNAGSRVAFAHASVTARLMRCLKCMVGFWL